MNTLSIILVLVLGLGIPIISSYLRHYQMHKLARQLGCDYAYSSKRKKFSITGMFADGPNHLISGNFKGKLIEIYDEYDEKYVTSIIIDGQLEEVIRGILSPSIKTIKAKLNSYL